MIRNATQKDALNLAALSIQVWLHTYADEGIRDEISNFVFANFTETIFERRIQSTDYPILVAEENGHLVGYVMAHLKSFWQGLSNGYEIDKLYVQEPFQGKGVGRRLLMAMAEEFGHPFWLSTWVHNKPAIDFYQRLGFTDAGHTDFKLADECHQNQVFVYRGNTLQRITDENQNFNRG